MHITNVVDRENYFQDALLAWQVLGVTRFCEMFVWATIMSSQLFTVEVLPSKTLPISVYAILLSTRHPSYSKDNPLFIPAERCMEVFDTGYVVMQGQRGAC